MEIDRDAIIEGVQKAMAEVFDNMQLGGRRNYLNDLISEGVAKATREWLDENEEAVLAAIQAAHSSEQ
jgi:hypothetical protein